MCGRFSLAVDGEFLAQLFDLLTVPLWQPRYNIAPTQPIVTIQGPRGERQGVLTRWGLIPGWTKDPSDTPLMINARSESAREKPSFRNRVKKGRCLVPADGFFEWKAQPAGKQPFWFSFGVGKPFAFAALWDLWKPPVGDPILSCAILTTQAKGWMTQYHERMPVLLEPTDWDLWLNPGEISPSDWERWTGAFPAEPMRATAVSTLVNRADHDGPECIKEWHPPSPPAEGPPSTVASKPRSKKAQPPPGKGLFDP